MDDLAVLFVLFYVVLVVVENGVKIWRWTQKRKPQ